MKNRRVDLFFIIMVVLYFVLQMTVVFLYNDTAYLGSFENMDNDDVKYVRSALNVIEKGKLYYQNEEIEMDVPTVFIMPGYPLFLAFFIKLFGGTHLWIGLFAIRVVQGLLQLGVMALLYRIGKKFFHVWVGRLAAVLFLLYIPNLEAPLLLLTETLFTFFFVLLIYLCFEALETKKMSYYVWGGIVLGLAAMVRPTVLLFPIVILLMWLLKKYSWREMLVRGLVVGGILIVLFAPWWIRNALIFERFIPMTVAAGDPFMQGASYLEFDMSDYPDAIQPGMDSFEIDKVKKEIGDARLQEAWQMSPLATIHWFTLGKTYELWKYPFYNYPQGNLMLGVPFAFVHRCHWLLLGLAGLGIVLMCLKRTANRRLKLFVPATIFFMCVPYLIYFAFSRYTFPLMPLVILLAAFGIFSAVKFTRRELGY